MYPTFPKSRYLPISEYRRDYYICRKGKESEAKSVFLLQPGARTGKDEGTGQQDCRYPVYRGEYGRRRAIAGKQSYQEIQATLQRTVERRQNISQHLRAERILSTRLQNPEDNPQRLLLLWPLQHIPSMYALLDLIKHLYPLRTCHLNLSPENIRAGKFNVCLEYHIKNCAGPCIGKQSQEDYLKNIGEIKEILKGNTQEIERMLFQQMQELAAEMKFEEAQKIKEKYLLLENYRAKSEVVSNVLHNIDVFSIEEDNDGKSLSSTTYTLRTAPSTRLSPLNTRND